LILLHAPSYLFLFRIVFCLQQGNFLTVPVVQKEAGTTVNAFPALWPLPAISQ
jgi:hypothetical protein